jgi:hypothetical protein
LSRYGFIYINAILGPDYTRISWEGNKGSGATDDFNIQTLFELGYNLFIDSNWYFRVYTRSFNENQNVWRDAVSKAAGQEVNVTSSDFIQVGVSVGYYFPAEKNPARHLR